MLASRPKLSVVIPTCNRPEALGKLLALLKDQAAESGAEVIVANDGADLTESFRTSFSWVCFLAGPRRGPAANRNCGARRAGGEWILFLDDDCLPNPRWLAAFGSATAGSAPDLLEGRVEATGWTGHPLDERIENVRGGVFWSCNLAVRREFFEMCGGFDEDFRQAAFEDMEFSERAQRLGARTAFVEGAVVEHPVRRLTLGQLWRRTLLLRWYALYLRKTMPDSGPGAGALIVAVNSCRGVARRLLDMRSAHWPRSVFLALWDLCTFPLVLPYVCFWDVKYWRLQSKMA